MDEDNLEDLRIRLKKGLSRPNSWQVVVVVI